METEENYCCYPDCKSADAHTKAGLCLEHEKLARFIIETSRWNLTLNDFV